MQLQCQSDQKSQIFWLFDNWSSKVKYPGHFITKQTTDDDLKADPRDIKANNYTDVVNLVLFRWIEDVLVHFLLWTFLK